VRLDLRLGGDRRRLVGRIGHGDAADAAEEVEVTAEEIRGEAQEQVGAVGEREEVVLEPIARLRQQGGALDLDRETGEEEEAETEAEDRAIVDGVGDLARLRAERAVGAEDVVAAEEPDVELAAVRMRARAPGEPRHQQCRNQANSYESHHP
jgi:hypothetical protein